MTELPNSMMQRWLVRISLVLAMMLVAVGLLAADARSAPLAQANMTFQKSFTPDKIGPGSVTTLRFDIVNHDSDNPIFSPTFTDTLPAGVVIASPAQAGSTCPGNLIAPDGGGSIEFEGERLGPSSACTILVDVTSGEPGVYTNTSGDLKSSSGNHGNATADLTVDAGRPGFVKSFTPDTIPPGEISTLTLTIDNTANGSAVDSLIFADVLPAGMVIATPANASSSCTGGVPSNLTAVPGTNTINHFYGHVNGLASCAITVDVITDGTGTFVNTTGELLADSLVSGKASAVLDVPVNFLTKSFIDDPVAPGDPVTLRFTVTNLSRGEAATAITFSDDLDATLQGLVAVGLPANGVCGIGSQLSGADLLTLTGGNLAAEASCTFDVMLQVPAAAATGTYTNTTSPITANIDGEPIVADAAIDSLVVDVAPVLTKSFTDDPAAPGGDVTLSFTITNTSAISGVLDIGFDDNLTALIPGTTATLPADGFCGGGSAISEIVQADGLHLTVTGGSLDPGASCTFTTTVHIPPGVPGGVYPNVTSPVNATLDGEPLIGMPATDDLIVVGAPMLTKSFTDDPVKPGDTVTLEFILANPVENGPADASSIGFSDNLDAVLPGLVAVGLPASDVCGPGSELNGTSNLVFSGGSLGAGEFCVFEVTLQVPAAAPSGAYMNTTSDVTATVMGMEVNGGPASNELDVAGLTLKKSFTDDPVLPGETTTLEFTINNESSILNASDIIFSDNLNATLPGLTAVGLPGSDYCGPGSSVINAGSTLFFIGGSLGANVSCTFSVTLLVPLSTEPGLYNNVTSQLSANAEGTPLTAAPAADVLIVPEFLHLTKTFLDDSVMPGDNVTLEFNISNTHTAEGVNAIAFTDDLDAALAGLAAVGLPASDVCGAGSEIKGTGLLEFTGGSLAPGVSCSFTVTLQVPLDVSTGGDVVNTTSQITGLVNGVQVKGSAATDVFRVYLFTFSKAFDRPTKPGGTPTLSFTIENIDPSIPVRNLGFSDDLDGMLPGLVALGLPAADVCGPGSLLSGTSSLTLVNGNLEPGASCTFDVTLDVPLAAPPGDYLNTTSPLLLDGQPVSSPATATLTVEPLVFSYVPFVIGGYTPPGRDDGGRPPRP